VVHKGVVDSPEFITPVRRGRADDTYITNVDVCVLEALAKGERTRERKKTKIVNETRCYFQRLLFNSSLMVGGTPNVEFPGRPLLFFAVSSTNHRPRCITDAHTHTHDPFLCVL